MDSTFAAHYEDAKIAGGAASLVGDLWAESFGPYDETAIDVLGSIREYLYDRAEIAIQFALLVNDLEYAAKYPNAAECEPLDVVC